MSVGVGIKVATFEGWHGRLGGASIASRPLSLLAAASDVGHPLHAASTNPVSGRVRVVTRIIES